MSNSHVNPIALPHYHGRQALHQRIDLESRRKFSGAVDKSHFPSIENDCMVDSDDDENPESSLGVFSASCIAHSTITFQNLIDDTRARQPQRELPLETRFESGGESGGSTHRKYIAPNYRKEVLELSDSAAPVHSSPPKMGRYVPPGLRDRHQGGQEGFRTLEERERAAYESPVPIPQDFALLPSSGNLDILDDDENCDSPFHLGGCADPRLVTTSIMDASNIPIKASIVARSPVQPFGSSRFGREVGAISECGIRDSNEDAYLIANDLNEVFTSVDGISETVFQPGSGGASLFAIFDGHSGNQAARFAAEKLTEYLKGQVRSRQRLDRENISSTLRDALIDLDNSFCQLCHEEGRQWESGTTALVAVLMGNSLTIANLGDCRGVVCRAVEKDSSLDVDWNVLEVDGRDTHFNAQGEGILYKWKEVASVHKPSDENERKRIENANGWITTETEIPIGQLRRMDFLDEDVVGILRRCFSDRYDDSGGMVRECKSAPQRILNISRVCGELAVSRAIGDRDLKSIFHQSSHSAIGGTYGYENAAEWLGPSSLSYPDDHSRVFRGNLVDNFPDVVQIEMGGSDSNGEFLLFASDGLWVRVNNDFSFSKITCTLKIS